jgi:hypothetical protein
VEQFIFLLEIKAAALLIKGLFTLQKTLPHEERLFEGLSLLSFKVKALRQISTFALEKRID